MTFIQKECTTNDDNNENLPGKFGSVFVLVAVIHSRCNSSGWWKRNNHGSLQVDTGLGIDLSHNLDAFRFGLGEKE